ncbi:MAG: NYN domain-containing protein [Eggerthellaceae bacterium]|nr:NYN domain-containing protein [Eggerthellaceae bacterium]
MKTKKETRTAQTQTKTQTTGRKLCFIDIENFIGKAQFTLEDAQKARKRIEKVTGLSDHDLIVVGTSHSANFFSAKMAWNGAQHVWGKGKNGGDNALLETVPEYKVENFEEVVFVTGDGIFADMVDEIAARGTIVTVIYGRGYCSNRLKAVATCVAA